MKKNIIKKIFILIVISFILTNLICINFSLADESLTTSEEVVKIIKESVAKWYYIMRLIVIAFMLILLIFIGIKMAISVSASDKAVYKQMIVDWVVGMIIVFFIHYIMIAILTINDNFVGSLKPLAEKRTTIKQEYEYGDEKNLKTSSEIETTLYEETRTRAYSMKLTDGFTGMILYGILVYYAWKFALMYFRRVINIVILTLLAPAVSASYAFNKVISGKSKIFSTWLSEFVMNVIIQIVHVIIYVSFVSIALQLSLESLSGMILAFILLNFMTKGDKMLRQLFRLSGGAGSLSGDLNDRTSFKQIRDEMMSLKTAMVGGVLTKAAIKNTYGLAAKPFKAAGLEAASRITAGVLNRRLDKKSQAEESKEEVENQELNEFLEKNKDLTKITEKEEEKEKILKAQKESEKKVKELEDKMEEEGLDYGSWQLNSDWVNEKEKIEKNKKDIDNLNKDIKKIEDAMKKEFITEQFNKDVPISTIFKENLTEAFMGLVEQKEVTRKDKNGDEIKTRRYVSKKVNTIKEGGFKRW